MSDPVSFLLARRSSRILDLVAPGPSAQELDTILTIAARVPDHGKLAPWRFIVFEGDGRLRAGDALAAVLKEVQPDAGERRVEEEKKRLARAPLVIAIVSSAAAHVKIPEAEQYLSAAAAAYNTLLAALALGYGATWLTEWPVYEPKARAALGLAAHEKLVGFVHVGTATQQLEDRPRPALADVVTRF